MNGPDDGGRGARLLTIVRARRARLAERLEANRVAYRRLGGKPGRALGAAPGDGPGIS